MKIVQTVTETLPPGEYAAQLEDVLEGEGGAFGPYVKLVFKVSEPGYENTKVTGAASMKFSPSSKLYSWVKALFNDRAIPKGYDFNSDDVVGRQCRLVLKVTAGENGVEYNRIELVLPAQKAGAAAKPAATPAPAAPTKNAAEALPFPAEPPPDPDSDTDGYPF